MMSNGRWPTANLVVGFPGTGKTTFVKKAIAASGLKNALFYLEGEDIDSPALQDIKERSIWKYKGGFAKINSWEIDYKAFLQVVRKYYRDGALVIDEGGEHEKYTLTDEMAGLMRLRRKLGIEIYMLYHGVQFLPIEQYQFINNLILFDTTDEFAYKAKKIPRYADLIAAKKRIAARVAAGDQYYGERIVLKQNPQ